MTLEEAREVLISHSKSRRNGVFDERADHVEKLLNPVCGDQIELRAQVVGGRLEAVGFAAKACAICTASVSILSDVAEGLKPAAVVDLRQRFEMAITQSPSEKWPTQLKEFECFEHLRVNPRRRACAILPWIALERLASQELGRTRNREGSLAPENL